MNKEIAIILGTRPEIIKLAPIIRLCEDRSIPYFLLHTGQHYTNALDDVFFDQLELPEPDVNLSIGSKTHGHQTGEMIGQIERVLLDRDPDVVLVQGDTNSVLAGAIAASKLDMELGHVEAGLRSFDRQMPEEVNRVLADHAADFLFAPTPEAAGLLRDEGLPEERIYVTGNTVVDTVEENLELSRSKSSILETLSLTAGEFGLLTAHRAENVDDEQVFASILRGVGTVAERTGMHFVYPIHPRAKKQIHEFELEVPDGLELIPPQDYLDFLRLESEARLILTDSGGVQEEACVLRTPCVTVRENTERPETINVGANELVGTDPTAIVAGAEQMLQVDTQWRNPFGDGNAARRILRHVTGRELGQDEGTLIDEAPEAHTD